MGEPIKKIAQSRTGYEMASVLFRPLSLSPFPFPFIRRAPARRTPVASAPSATRAERAPFLRPVNCARSSERRRARCAASVAR